MKFVFAIILIAVILSFNTYNPSLAFQQKTDINAVDRDGKTALINAVIASKLPEVKVLLTKGANVNCQDKEGRTPLIWSVVTKNLELVKTLLDAGADINIKDKKNYLAVMYAHDVGFKEIEAVLKDAKDSYGRTSLIKAVSFDERADVLTLLKYGFNINATDANGFTPLMYASTAGNKEMVLLLISNGANPGQIATNGKTASSLAFDEGYSEVANLLEEKVKPSDKPKTALSFTSDDAPKSTLNLAPDLPKVDSKDDDKAIKAKHRELVNAFFNAQRLGREPYDYFCDPALASKLFNVVSYEIVDQGVINNFGTFVVKVESSTKGGTPIRVLWRVNTRSQNGIYCVTYMSKSGGS